MDTSADELREQVRQRYARSALAVTDAHRWAKPAAEIAAEGA
jgi:hypothetical protein